MRNIRPLLGVSASFLKHAWAQILAVFHRPGVQAAFKETKLELSFAILLTSLFILVVWFSQATLPLPPSESAKAGTWKTLSALGISDTLAILRTLQGILTTSSTYTLGSAFDTIVWILTNRKSGIRTLSLLGLSSVTGPWGVLGLLFSKHAKEVDRLAAVAKITLYTILWVSGILLFANTKITLVNQTLEFSTYNVTAGIGAFRGTYVSPFLEQLRDTNGLQDDDDGSILPYSIITTASQLILNTIHSATTTPVDCDQGKRCTSYLIPGGLRTSTPWPPTDNEDYPTITIYNAPATQIDFLRNIEQEEMFDDAQDCLVYGTEGYRIGIQFCLTESKLKSDSLLAGLFVCQNGTQGGECLTSINPPKLITTFSAYQRRATVTSARSNMSILMVQDLSPPIQQVNLPIDALKQSFSWLFNATAAGVPAPSSVAQYFWSANDQLNNEYYSIEPYQQFQSLLAFPFWHFNDNNYGNVRLQTKTMIDSLPDEFYTFAAVDKPMAKISVDRGMFIAFCILQSICILCVWAALICRWTNYDGLANISSYPLIDFAMKTQQQNGASQTSSPDGHAADIGTYRSMPPSTDDKFIRNALKHERTLMRRAKYPGSGCTIPLVARAAHEVEHGLPQNEERQPEPEREANAPRRSQTS